MAWLQAIPLTSNPLLNVVAVVVSLALAWVVLRFFLKAARVVLTVGCLGGVAVVIFFAVVAYLGRG